MNLLLICCLLIQKEDNALVANSLVCRMELRKFSGAHYRASTPIKLLRTEKVARSDDNISNLCHIRVEIYTYQTPVIKYHSSDSDSVLMAIH